MLYHMNKPMMSVFVIEKEAI